MKIIALLNKYMSSKIKLKKIIKLKLNFVWDL